MNLLSSLLKRLKNRNIRNTKLNIKVAPGENNMAIANKMPNKTSAKKLNLFVDINSWSTDNFLIFVKQIYFSKPVVIHLKMIIPL